MAVTVALAIPLIASNSQAQTLFGIAVGSLVFALGLLLLQSRSKRHLAALGHHSRTVPLCPRLHLRVAAGPNEVLDLLETGIRGLASSGDRVKIEKCTDGLIATLPPTLRHGYGERIEVLAASSRSGGLDVWISSRPNAGGVLVDLGRNLRHVLALRRVLEDAYGPESVREVALEDSSAG